MDFNDQLLEALGTRWDDWLPINGSFSKSPQWADFIKRGTGVLREEFEDAPLFVLKDPRICRVAALWFDILAQENIDVRIVMPIRNPLEVARSIAARNNIDEHLCLLIWLRYVIDAEAASRGMKRVIISYDQLLEDWRTTASTISKTLDVVWPRLSANTAKNIDEFIEPDERHQKVDPAILMKSSWIAPWVTEVYRILNEWGNSGESVDGYAKLDEIKAKLDAATPIFARPLLTARDDRERRQALETEMRDLEAKQENLSHELHALQEQLGAEIARAEELRQTITDFEQSQLVDREAIAAALAGQEQLSAALDAAHQRIAASDEMNVQLGIARAAAEAQVQSMQAKVDDLGHQLALNQSTLRQREEEISQMGDQADALRSAQREAEARLDNERSAWEESRSRLERERDEAKRLADEFHMRMLKVEGICDDNRLALEAMETERNRAQRDYEAVRAKAAESSQEIARIIVLLQQSEDAAQIAQDEIDWLREVNAAAGKVPAWWSLMPQSLRARWKEGLMRRRGLFDADAYRQRYPDVAAANFDPLEHYLRHGMAEGRLR